MLVVNISNVITAEQKERIKNYQYTYKIGLLGDNCCQHDIWQKSCHSVYIYFIGLRTEKTFCKQRKNQQLLKALPKTYRMDIKSVHTKIVGCEIHGLKDLLKSLFLALLHMNNFFQVFLHSPLDEAQEMLLVHAG